MAKKFTQSNFEEAVLRADKPVLVDFYADWCGPCKMMAPIVEKMADEYEGRAVIGKLNTDENMDISKTYNIMSIPTLILFKGGEAKEVMVGLQKKEDIAAMVEKYL